MATTKGSATLEHLTFEKDQPHRFKMTERHWKYRRPPDGFLPNQLMLCIMPQPCVFKDSCPNAHSEEELSEWKKRLEECDDLEYIQPYSDPETVQEYRRQIVQKMNESEDPDHMKSIVTELIGGFLILCDENLYVMHIEPGKDLAWMFTVKNIQAKATKKLDRVYFLNECPEFKMSCCIIIHTEKSDTRIKLPKGSNFWENTMDEKGSVKEIKILVQFKGEKFGNYAQELIFDFGGYPKAVKKLGVQVASEESLSKFMNFDPKTEENNELAWKKEYEINKFGGGKYRGLDDIQFPLPPNIANLVMFDAFKHLDVRLTKSNYRERLHTLLYIEEFQRRADLQSMTFHVEDFAVCLDAKSKSKRTMAKTATIEFNESVLELLTKLVGKSGRALLRVNEHSTLTRVIASPVVYEVIVQNMINNSLVLELSEECFKLINNSAIPVNIDVSFCLVDMFQPLHLAIEKVNLDLVFPTIRTSCNLPGTSSLKLTDPALSSEQNKAIDIILQSKEEAPVLLLGPFGAGKTRTIASCVNQIVAERDSNNRILICTHSNSAADHYIEEYFHPKHNLENGVVNSRLVPLRINWEYRYTTSVSDRVLPYCLQDMDTGLFKLPTKDDLDKHSIVICTLVTSEVLYKLNLPEDYFSHIFIDEAAQAMEVEALVPLLLATTKTRIVLAGDHLQMGESLFSLVAKNLGLEQSLLERLFEYYPFDVDCKLKLLENYRSYKEIVDLSSHLFYEDSLISNKTRRDGVAFPIEFHGVKGEEYLSTENPSYENLSEATKVLEVVRTLREQNKRKKSFRLSTICVVAFYPAQVRCIRKVLRKNKMSEIRVESVNNIQGLEFDTLLISTVRTYCESTIHDESYSKDLGFFTNPKLLNTAITRARYRAILIGDAEALCFIGNCKPCWRFILRYCEMHKTFYNDVPFYELFRPVEDSKKEEEEIARGAALDDLIAKKLEAFTLMSPAKVSGESPIKHAQDSPIKPIGKSPLKLGTNNSPTVSVDKSEVEASNSDLIKDIARAPSSSGENLQKAVGSPLKLYSQVASCGSTSSQTNIISNETKPDNRKKKVENKKPPPGLGSTSTAIALPDNDQKSNGKDEKPALGLASYSTAVALPDNSHSQNFLQLAPPPVVPGTIFRNAFVPGVGWVRQPIAVAMVPVRPAVCMSPPALAPHVQPMQFQAPPVTQQKQQQQQQHRQNLILLAAQSATELRHKIQFIHEYALNALKFVGAAEPLVEHIKRGTVTAFQDMESASELRDVLANKLLYEIELEVENVYTDVHDFVGGLKNVLQNFFHYSQLSVDRLHGLESKLKHLETQFPINTTTEKVKCFLYVLRMLGNELEICRKLMFYPAEACIFMMKTDFVDAKLTEMEDISKKMLDTSQGSESSQLELSSVDDIDDESKKWFSQRRNDPYVKEYQVAHNRRLAGRLPSPTPGDISSTKMQ